MAKLTIEEIKAIVEAITYKPDWQIILGDDGERMYVQIEATTLDSITKVPTKWKSGKTYLSPFMCRQEIVGSVFSTIEKAELHEIREFFRYKGASIFNPHLDPDVLAEVAKKASSFNVRDNAMSMEEPAVAETAKTGVDPRKDNFRVRNSVSGNEYKWYAAEGRLYSKTASWSYSIEDVVKMIEKGTWVVIENLTDPTTQSFKFKHAGNMQDYYWNATERTVQNRHGGHIMDYSYEEVKGFLALGVWVVVE